MTDLNKLLATMSAGTEGGNDYRLKELMKAVGELGRDMANGSVALPKLGMSVLSAMDDGIITLEKDVDGQDDVARLYRYYLDNYSQRAGKSAFATINKDSFKANVWKLRTIARMAKVTACEPKDVMERGLKIHRESLAAGEKVKAPYTAMIAIAAEQAKLDRPLTDDELRDLVRPPEPKSKALIDLFDDVRKRIEGIVSGENKAKEKDTDEKVEQAYRLIERRMKELLGDTSTPEATAPTVDPDFDEPLIRTDGDTFTLPDNEEIDRQVSAAAAEPVEKPKGKRGRPRKPSPAPPVSEAAGEPETAYQTELAATDRMYPQTDEYGGEMLAISTGEERVGPEDTEQREYAEQARQVPRVSEMPDIPASLRRTGFGPAAPTVPVTTGQDDGDIEVPDFE